MKRFIGILMAIAILTPAIATAQNQITRPKKQTEQTTGTKTQNSQRNQPTKISNTPLPMTEEETSELWFDCYPNHKKMAKAIEILKRAHEKGNRYASQWIGLYYLRGWYKNRDGEQSKDTEAVKWLQISIENGNSSSYNHLAECYYYGEGVKKDIVKVTELLEKAIELGDIHAKKTLEYYQQNFKSDE